MNYENAGINNKEFEFFVVKKRDSKQYWSCCTQNLFCFINQGVIMFQALQEKDGYLQIMSMDECYVDHYSNLRKVLWISLVNPSDDELSLIESVCNYPLPTIRDIEELEARAHYGTCPDGGIQISCLFLHKEGDNQYRNTNVAFILINQQIISISAREIPEVNKLIINNNFKKIKRNSDILFALLEAKVDGLADTLEASNIRFKQISKQILSRDKTNIETMIERLAIEDDLIGKVHICLLDGQRDISYLKRSKWLPHDESLIQGITEDMISLLSHNIFLSEKIDFLLNATQGFINIEQNKIIKTFSIAAVIFLPPTLVASIYGMNFEHMPELSWKTGYPLSILLMILAGLAPYAYFKRKGWF
jgi:magnesium transporter